MESGAAQVYGELRRRLRTDLTPGTHITEHDLANATGHSRASVRGALARAHAEGILVGRTGCGSVVTPRSARMQAQLWACLAGLEEVLVQRLADTGTDVASVRSTIAAEDDLDFHRALGELLPDEPVTLLHRQVIARLEQGSTAGAEQLFVPATLHHAHDELLQSIIAPAPAYAARLAREHLEELAAAAAY